MVIKLVVLIASVGSLLVSSAAWFNRLEEKKSEIQSQPRLIAEGLKITVPQSALPMAALNELRLPLSDPIQEVQWRFPSQFETLASGKVYRPLQIESRRLPATKLITVKPSSVKILEPFVVRKEKRIEPIVMKVPSVTREAVDENSNDEYTNVEVRRRPVVDQPSDESFASLARFLVEKELAEQQLTSKTVTVVKAKGSSGGGKSVIVRPADGQQDHRKSVGFVKTESDKNETSEASKFVEPPTDVMVSGQIEMSGGLAFLGNVDEIFLYRESEGWFAEEGQVFVKTGSFEIQAKELTGLLVAQLRDERGSTLGEGIFDLASINLDQIVGGKVGGVLLTIKPLEKGIVGKVVSAYSFGDHDILVPGAKLLTSVFDDFIPVKGDGTFHEEEVAKNSGYQAKAFAEQHWGTLVAGVAGSKREIQLFPNAMISALIEISLGYQDNALENMAVIWGRVEESGHPLENATVELAGTDLRPIYFNSLMIPDRSLRSTSKNGLFAYIGVEAGIHQVRANYDGRALPSQVIAAENQYVSHVLLQKVATHRVPVKSFDAFQPDQPLSTVLRVLGDENLVEIGSDGEGVMDLPAENQLMFLEASSFGEFEAMRMIKSRSESFIYLPMVKTSWIIGLAENADIAIEEDKGIVLGFVSGEEGAFGYEAILGSDGQENGHQIIYFDAGGSATQNAVVGGGFIIFNLDTGLQTVIVSPQEQYDIVSKVAFVEPGVLSVLQTNIH